MQDFFKTVYRLDAQGSIAELLAFIQKPEHTPDTLFWTLSRLLPSGQLRAAYLLAMLLANRGFQHTTIAIALHAGGLLFNDPVEEERGLVMLRTQTTALPVDQQSILFDQLMGPVITHLLKQVPKTADRGWIMRIFNSMTTALPTLRARWDTESPVPIWSLETIRHLGQGAHPSLSHPIPPDDIIQRRVVVAMRTGIFPKRPYPNPPMDIWSYPSDIEHRLATESRLVAALNVYGWQARVCDIHSVDWLEDSQTIISACLQQQAQMLILDEQLILTKKTEPEASRISIEMLALLRRLLPSLKIVMTLLDTESIDQTALLECAPFLDVIWGAIAPSLAIWNHPVLANKVLHQPIPYAVGHEATFSQPLERVLWFDEDETGYRTFWLTIAQTVGLPVQRGQKFMGEAGWSPLERYAAYRQAKTMMPSVLRFALRPGSPSPVTDRTFEALLSGALLVQESPSDLSHYFIPGLHYLPFSSLAELSAVVQFIWEHPQEAEAIRRCGHAFACERYSDAQLIRQLEVFVYHTAQKSAALDTIAPIPIKRELLSFEYISVHKWCRSVSPAELLTQSGPAICRFDARNQPQPALNFGLHLQGEGYEDLFPCTEESVGANAPNLDYRTRSILSQPPFIARLENVRIEFPGMGIFLDRHLMMEESYHQKDYSTGVISWYGNNSRRRVCRTEIPVEMSDGLHSMPIDLNVYINKGVDQYEEGPILLISGASFANWHHWFIEMLPRLWAMQAIPELAQLPLVLRAPVQSFQWETLLALGIDPARIRLFTGETLQVKTLIFPSYIAPLSHTLNNVTWLQENLLPAMGVDRTLPAEELIYLSRNQLAGRPRGILNEEAVVTALQSRGFQVVFPEQMDVKEKLKLYNRAKVIVAPYGSGGTNILFCQPGTTLIELMSYSFRQFLNLIYASLNHCFYGCLICADGDPVAQEMIVDVEALLRVIDKILTDGPSGPKEWLDGLL